MTHVLETTGPTIDEQITAAAAQVIYARMTEEEKAEIGTEGMFGAMTVEEIVREAVRKAGRDGMRYKFGTYAKMIFGLPDND